MVLRGLFYIQYPDISEPVQGRVNKIYLSPVVFLMNGQNFCIVFFVVNIQWTDLKASVCVIHKILVLVFLLFILFKCLDIFW